MSMPEQQKVGEVKQPTSGFQIGSRFYPFPTKFRLGDPVLIEELTGLEFEAFLERLPDDDSDEEEMDPIATLGLIGVAIWQEHKTWKRDRVVRYAQQLDRDMVEVIGPEMEAKPQPGDPDYEEGGDLVPLETKMEEPGSGTSETPPPQSDTVSASPSEPAIQATSGTPD